MKCGSSLIDDYDISLHVNRQLWHWSKFKKCILKYVHCTCTYLIKHVWYQVGTNYPWKRPRKKISKLPTRCWCFLLMFRGGLWACNTSWVFATSNVAFEAEKEPIFAGRALDRYYPWPHSSVAEHHENDLTVGLAHVPQCLCTWLFSLRCLFHKNIKYTKA